MGDNTGNGEDMLRPIRFQCVGFYISAGLTFTYVDSWYYVHSDPTCEGSSPKQLLRTSWKA